MTNRVKQVKHHNKIADCSEKYIGAIALSLTVITLFSGVVQSGIFLNGASADIVSTLTINVDTACSLTANTDLSHTATLVPGVYSESYDDGNSTPYADGIGSTTITAFCNDNAGYAIYAVGYTNDTVGSTNMVGNNTGSTIPTSTATSGGTSSWSMKLAKVLESGISYNPDNLTIENNFDGYHAIPSTYTRVASYASNTDAIKGSKLTTTYAAYIQPAQVADTYIGQVKYTLVHPNTNDPSSFIINFNANGGTGTMDSQKIIRDTPTILTSNSFTAPTGLNFIGWNTVSDGTGTYYANGQAVTNIANAGDTITLYAQWEDPSAYTSATITNTTYMQDVEVCDNTVTEGIRYSIKDSRDGQWYTVSKLADGKCWMTSNLNLAGGTELYSDDSNVPSGYTEDPYYTLPVSLSEEEELSEELLLINGFSDDTEAYVYNSDNTEECGNSGNNSPCGSYYSYLAATAGSGADVTTDGENAAYSICPKGWRLPTATTSDANARNDGNWKTGDWYALASAYGVNLEDYHSGNNSNADITHPAAFYENAGPGTVPNFLFAGMYNKSNGSETTSFSNGGKYGYYWSSTASSDTNAYYSNFTNNSVGSAVQNGRRRGYSVRCIFED